MKGFWGLERRVLPGKQDCGKTDCLVAARQIEFKLIYKPPEKKNRGRYSALAHWENAQCTRIYQSSPVVDLLQVNTELKITSLDFLWSHSLGLSVSHVFGYCGVSSVVNNHQYPTDGGCIWNTRGLRVGVHSALVNSHRLIDSPPRLASIPLCLFCLGPWTANVCCCLIDLGGGSPLKNPIMTEFPLRLASLREDPLLCVGSVWVWLCNPSVY